MMRVDQTGMDIQKSFETLDLKQDASPEEAKQAYIAKVKFYHPDQFFHDPSHRKSGEEKLKEINLAYEQVKSFLSSKPLTDKPSYPGPSSSSPVKDKERAEHKTRKERARHFTGSPGARKDAATKNENSFAGMFRKAWASFVRKLDEMEARYMQEEMNRVSMEEQKSFQEKEAKKSFSSILRDAEKNGGRVNTRNVKSANKLPRNARNRKGTPWDRDTGRGKRDVNRVEPVSRVRPVDRVGAIDGSK